MIKRPLLGWVVSLIIGILCYRIKTIYMIGIAIVLWVVLLLPSIIRKIPIPFTKEDWHRYLWPVFFILGFMCMHSANQISNLESELTDSCYGKVYGEITDIKQKGENITLLLKKIKVYNNDKDQWYEDCGAIVSTTHNYSYAIGNQILIHGTIGTLTKPTNPGQFDEYSYYKMRDVVCKVYADEITIVNTSTSLFDHSIYRLRCRLVEQIQALLPEEEAGLMSAILFGDKTLLSDEMKKLYQENGFAHIMAVSGLHVSLLGYGLYQLLRKMTTPVWASTLIPVIVLFLYGAIVGFSVSSCRAILMFAMLMLSTYIGRWYDMISALSLAAIILLLIQPLYLYDAGFLLSFASVIGIAVIYPRLCDAFVAEKKRGVKTKKAFLLSASIQLMTLPLTCYFFFEISLYSLLINLILLPLCSYLVFSSLLACLFSFVFLPIGQFIVGSAYYIMQFFSFILHIPEKLPYHLILVGKLAIAQIIGYYLVLIAACLAYRMEQKRFRWYGLVFLLLFLQVKLPKSLSINCLDVAQGDCMIITNENQVVMIDGGSISQKQIYEYRIKPYLKSNGIRHINTVFLTHADTDHMSGILECLQKMQSNSVAMKDYNGEITIGTLVIPMLDFYDEAYQEVILLAIEKKVKVITMQEGQEYEVGNVTYQALHPTRGYPTDNRNNTSLVLWAKYREFDGLFLGDIDQAVEDLIVQSYHLQFLKESFEFLKVAHHGSKYSTSEKLLTVVRPKVAVISVGKKNRYGHPHSETILKLKESNSIIRMTNEEGAIIYQY